MAASYRLSPMRNVLTPPANGDNGSGKERSSSEGSFVTAEEGNHGDEPTGTGAKEIDGIDTVRLEHTAMDTN